MTSGLGMAGEAGKLTEERWLGISGGTVANLTSNASYPNAPTSVAKIAGVEPASNVAENFGRRLRGFITAPQTGYFTFWVAGDDSGELWLSTSPDPAGKQKIAWFAGPTNARQWGKFATQKSTTIFLTQGNKYYLEVLHKEASGGDTVSIAWQPPGGTLAVIPATAVDAYEVNPNDQDNDGLPDDWEQIYGLSFDVSTGSQGINGASGDPDGDGFTNRDEWLQQSSPIVYDNIPGGLKREVWQNIPGTSVASLTTSPTFFKKPNMSDFIAGGSSPQNIADNFGQRLRGYVTIPATGSYRFFVASDDDSELWIASTGSPFDKKIAAFISGWSGFEIWTKLASQKSQSYILQQGQVVYVEILHKDATSGDYACLGWSLNDGTATKIPSTMLAAYAIPVNDRDDDGLPDDWEVTVGLNSNDNGGINPADGAWADSDLDGITNLEEWQTQGHPLERGGNVGILQRDIWNIPGRTVANLTHSVNFARQPDLAMQLSGSPLQFLSRGDNYGDRVKGCIVPPVSGPYRFWASGDNAVEFWLSTDRSRLNKQKIAFTNYSPVNNFDYEPSQKSAEVQLVAGVPYYYEILHKEEGGDDQFSIAWAFQARNLAGTGTASQSSNSSTQTTANKAIDGITSGMPLTQTLNQPNSWWKLSFPQAVELNRVVLFNRTDAVANQQWLSNFRISVLDASGNEVAGQNFYQGAGYVNGSLTWDLPVCVTAREIKVQLLGNNNSGNGNLSLAEVQVYQWQSMANRQVIGNQYIRSEYDEPRDLDEDSLPDDWENQMGLSSQDGGMLDSNQGEYGDPDHDLIPNFEEHALGLNPMVADSAPGRMLVEKWENVSAYSVGEFLGSGRLYEAADTSYLSLPQELKFEGEYFGSRSRGYITPATTGDYTFWISARTSAQLWISDNDQKGKYAKQLAAQMDADVGSGHGIGSTESNLWDRFSTQRSKKFHLEAGHSYYIEVLHQHGHTSGAHSSVAWALGNGLRETLPASAVSSYIQTADDSDDDYLPDVWEVQYGLSPQDRGQYDALKEGERGDFDFDGLTNREEYLLGTNPASTDSDGDGASDFDEVNRYGTSPVQGTIFSGNLVNTVNLDGYNEQASSGTWRILDGGLIGSSFRGQIQWTFTVPSDGWWVIDMAGRLRGDLRPSEDLPLGIIIDGVSLAPESMRFLNGRPSNLKVITPYLTAGTHTFTLDIRNEIGRRTLQIQSLNVSGTGGADIDGNGRPDWLDHLLADHSAVAPFAPTSVVSPLFIEGSSRFTRGAVLKASGQPVTVNRGLGDLHWYANVNLATSAATPIEVDLESGQTLADVTWIRWNALGGIPLTIRKGDSVKIGAWQSPGDAGTVQISVLGQSRSLSAADSFIQAFPQAGNYAVTVARAGSPTVTITISVVSADFGQPQSFYADVLTWRSFPAVSSVLKITAEPSLAVDESVAEGSGQKVKLRAGRAGTHQLAARLPNGPIVGFGTLNTLGVADALRGDAAEYVGSTADGYRVLRTPIVVTDLPVGGRVVLTIFRAGVTFLDGTTVMTLAAEDFYDGVAYVDFRYPSDMVGGYCHYIDVYDAQGRNLGRR